MPPRNLTTRSPHIGTNSSHSENSGENGDQNDPSDRIDPFNDVDDQYDGAADDSSDSQNQILMNNSSSDIKQHLLSYNKSFQHSSNSSLVNPFSSNNRLSALNDQQIKPQEFGRYPPNARFSKTSRVSSINSKLNGAGTAGGESYPLSDLNSQDQQSETTNPFIVDNDFSPFGGYPANSFPLLIDEKEDDDYLHNPDPIADAEYEKNRFWKDFRNLDKRSSWALFGLLLFFLGGVAIFVVVPALTYTGVTDRKPTINSYEILTSYVYPQLSAIRTDLVDKDTPEKSYTRKARDGSDWKLVFSDEFAAEGRTFYEGDDQFWYAPDFHYDATHDLEWYDPDAVSTSNGTLQLRMDAFKNHDLFYRSGMLHSWNRLCFTQGVLEISARLPNHGEVTGLWPGMWSMGNLGRPGYMATTEGVWPYSYEACDAGITANQSSPDGISYLPGQRLNSCTCPNEDHPNPGTGRGAPEIDILEGEVDTTIKNGVASQSMQIAPFDIWYVPDYNFIEIFNSSVTTINTYAGGPFQQAISAVTTLNTDWYGLGTGTRYFQNYAYEYLNDNDKGYCRWFVGDDPSVTVDAWSLAPNGNIDWRRISKEPMSIVMNLGISNNWAFIDWPSIVFPAIMEIDYVRIYQPEDAISLTCDPADYPTYDYINDHGLAYNIWNYTSWEAAGYSFPKNKLTGC